MYIGMKISSVTDFVTSSCLFWTFPTNFWLTAGVIYVKVSNILLIMIWIVFRDLCFQLTIQNLLWSDASNVKETDFSAIRGSCLLFLFFFLNLMIYGNSKRIKGIKKLAFVLFLRSGELTHRIFFCQCVFQSNFGKFSLPECGVKPSKNSASSDVELCLFCVSEKKRFFVAPWTSI